MEGLRNIARNLIKAGGPTEVRTEHLPNISPHGYCYTHLPFLMWVLFFCQCGKYKVNKHGKSWKRKGSFVIAQGQNFGKLSLISLGSRPVFVREWYIYQCVESAVDSKFIKRTHTYDCSACIPAWASWDRKIRSWVPQGPEPRMTVLAKASSIGRLRRRCEGKY
jgi:hypothetical protein